MNDKDRPPSHFCGLVVARFGEDFGLEFLVFDYRKGHGQTQVKFAGGTSKNKERPFLDIETTVRREAIEELGITVLVQEGKLHPARLVAEIRVSDNHRKYFFLVTDDEIGGSLRTWEIDDADERLSPPYWILAEVLAEKIFRGHIPGMAGALEQLSRVSEGVRSRYAYLLKEAMRYKPSQ